MVQVDPYEPARAAQAKGMRQSRLMSLVEANRRQCDSRPRRSWRFRNADRNANITNPLTGRLP